MNLKKKIAEKEEARLEKQVKAINAKSAEKPAQEKKRGRKKKTATTEESSAAVSEILKGYEIYEATSSGCRTIEMFASETDDFAEEILAKKINIEHAIENNQAFFIAEILPNGLRRDVRSIDFNKLIKLNIPDQSAKADCGKLHISYVPTEIIEAIAKVREFAHNKYGDGADRWFEIDKSRYREALLRHILRWWKNPDGKDEESGLPHLWHAACNISFLVSLEENNAD